MKIKKINSQGFLYVLPWLIGFIIFKIYPLVSSFYYSFTNLGLSRKLSFVGFKNYIDIFTKDLVIKDSVIATSKYVFVGVPFKIIFALLVATILSSKLKGINFFRTVYYIPSILSGSLSLCILWKLLFRDDGIVNSYLAMLNLPAVPWLTSKHIAIYSLCLLMAYGFGSSMVIFLAGLKQIPNELLEASQIEGCSKIQTYFKVKLPLITPMIFFNLIMQIVFAFQSLTEPYIITKGGPINSTMVLVLKLYNEAFINMCIGYGCAISWVMFAALGLITLLIFKSEKYWVHYMN